MHTNRLVPSDVSPEVYKALLNVDAALQQSTLSKKLMELVKIRASQINGCAFCLSLHTQEARRRGETQRRLDVLAGWRDADIYTAAEKAALTWTESLTHISERHASDEEYHALKVHFTDKEIVDLTTLVGLINLFNRLAISMRYAVTD